MELEDPMRTLSRTRKEYQEQIGLAAKPVFVLNQDLRIEDCNDAAAAVLHADRSALLGLASGDFLPLVQPDGPDPQETMRAAVRAALMSVPQSVFARLRALDGVQFDAIVELEACELDGESRIIVRVRDISRLRRAEQALGDSEERLRQVLEHTSAVVFMKDLDGKYLFVNRQFCDMFGRTEVELRGLRDADVFPPQVAARLRSDDRRVAKVRAPLEIEEDLVVDGRARKYLAIKFPLLGADGKPYAICGIATDITARTRTEAALRSAALAVSAAEGDTLFQELTRYLASTLDVECAFIALCTTADYGHVRTLSICADGSFEDNVEYALPGTVCGTVVGQEFRYIPSGVKEAYPNDRMFEQWHIEGYAAYPMSDSRGTPLGLIAVMSRRRLGDPELMESMLKIFAARAASELERRRSEELRRVSEASYRAIFEATEDAIFIHDWDTGAIVDVNPKAAEYYGYTPEEIKGLTVDDISSGVHPYTGAEAARHIERAKAGQPVRLEWHRKNRDGSLHWDEVCLKPVVIAGRKHILAVTREITDRKLAEDALRNAALAVSSAEGDGVFEELTRNLAGTLGVALVFIAVFPKADTTRLSSLAAWVDGRSVDNFDYPIAGTPCETVVGKTFRAYPTGVQALFPDDRTWPIEAESYAAYPMIDHQGQSLGLIAVIDRKPLRDPVLVESVLKIFATRAVSEVERQRADAELVASEEQYRAVFSSAVDGLVVLDEHGRIVDANPAFCTLVGYRREEITGRTPEMFLAAGHPELHDRLVASFGDGRPFSGECKATDRAGNLLDIEVRGVQMHYRGRPHILAQVRDLTRLRKAEQALEASELRLRQLMDNTPTVVFIRDLDGRYMYVNRRFCDMYGKTAEEVVGSLNSDLLPPEVVAMADANTARILEARAPMEFEEELQVGVKQMTFLASRFPLLDQQGEPYAVCAIATDITERKRTEQALRSSEQQYRSIFNASVDGMAVLDEQGGIADVNPAFLIMLGYQREDVLGRRPDDLLAPGSQEVCGELAAGIAEGRTFQRECTAIGADGQPVEIELRGARMYYQGRPHLLAIVRDIGARKRSEEERAQLESQLRQAQKMEAIGHLTGGIAHDFNNILTSIMGYLTLATERQADLDDPKLAKYLNQGQVAASRARDLIRQMLTFSRGQRGERRPLPLMPLIKEATRLLDSTLPSSVEIETRLAGNLPPVQVDPVQIEQVLLNLCINARDAMQGSGTIEIGARRVDEIDHTCASCRKALRGRGLVELSVHDTGRGIAPEVMERMFEPFFTTKDVGKGSGMGLSMVHGIVHDHGGHILVDTELGRGTTFRILFAPLEVSEQQGKARSPRRSRRAGEAELLAGRVLVVDDEEMVGEFMSELLESWGLEVTVQTSPLKACKLVERDPGRFDLVITDQTMPKLTGLDLACQLSNIKPQLPIILYTGYSDKLVNADLKRCGVLALLSKPVEPAALKAILRANLPATAAALAEKAQ